ncbi:hypothetical protein [Halobaculum sp. D14]|uniref:hypothetical protein n=1 Tax=Halobaculum sp. D14 TaxID=3421642 RepID=UPI003EBB54BF
MRERLVGLYRRNELFWVGLLVTILGALTPESLRLWWLDVSNWLVTSGGGLLLASVFVGLYRRFGASEGPAE